MSKINPPSNGVTVKTFGCRLNAFESEVMKKEAVAAGLGDLPGGTILFNTCAVTSEAVRQARQSIRSVRRENPDARIIVSGCAAQTEPQIFAQMDEVDLIIGNEEKLHGNSYRALPEFGVNDFEKVRVNDIMDVKDIAPHMIDGLCGRARAFVQVQNGCDHRCTFCIIPFGRGNSRSVPMGSVVDQVRRMVDLGHGEVVLTGIDITSYGADLPARPSLGKLVQSILNQVPELPRLRLSSIDSIEIDQPLLDAIAYEPRLMPHLHLSVQSGDNMILKRMKRRHLREHTIEFCQQIKAIRPDMVFGADMIAGFPTETENMFENSVRLIEECDLVHLHVFPFSSRPGTAAARMPPVAGSEIKLRAQRMRQAGERRYLAHLKNQHGRKVSVLVETGSVARSEQFTPVEGAGGTAGEICTVEISGDNGKALLAVPGRLKGKLHRTATDELAPFSEQPREVMV